MPQSGLGVGSAQAGRSMTDLEAARLELQLLIPKVGELERAARNVDAPVFRGPKGAVHLQAVNSHLDACRRRQCELEKIIAGRRNA